MRYGRSPARCAGPTVRSEKSLPRRFTLKSAFQVDQQVANIQPITARCSLWFAQVYTPSLTPGQDEIVACGLLARQRAAMFKVHRLATAFVR
jgi:hypothetical protein